jgi:hypothetical protein
MSTATLTKKTRIQKLPAFKEWRKASQDIASRQFANGVAQMIKDQCCDEDGFLIDTGILNGEWDSIVEWSKQMDHSDPLSKLPRRSFPK